MNKLSIFFHSVHLLSIPKDYMYILIVRPQLKCSQSPTYMYTKLYKIKEQRFLEKREFDYYI